MIYQSRGMYITPNLMPVELHCAALQVGDVELPPWAVDADDFVRQLGAALESDYVSEHLHEWVDLIFGVKQTGELAVAAGNLFGHLSYEGAVDIRKVKDPQERASILTQINEFGQTPTQLFEAAHPKRAAVSFIGNEDSLMILQ